MQSLIRNLWFGGALVLALAVGLYGSDLAPALIAVASFGSLGGEALAALGKAPSVHIVASLTLAGLTAFVFGFLGLAICDGVAAELSYRKLLLLRRGTRGDETPGREAFIDAFSSSVELTQAARMHASALYVGAIHKKPSGAMATVFRASAPAHASFLRDALVEHPLFLWFYRAMAIALAGSGALAFLAGTGDSGAGFAALTVGFLGAVVIVVLERLAVGYRHAQHTRLCATVDTIYRPGAETHHFDEVAAAARQSAELVARASEASAEDLRETMSAATKSIAAEFAASAETIAKSIEAAAKASKDEIGKSVSEALSKPMANLEKAVASQTGEQSERVQGLIEQATKALLADMATTVGGQYKDLLGALQSAVASVERVESAYAKSLDAVAKQAKDSAQSMAKEFKGAMNGVKNGEVKARKERNDALRDMAKLMADEFKGHSAGLQAALDKAVKSAETLSAKSVEKTAADLAETAQSFGKLNAGVENLVAMITPVLQQAIANQESILAALESESSNSKVLGRAANEMNAAAQASRNTVDRFLALAEALRETTAAIKSGEAVAANRNEPAIPEKEVARAAGGKRGHSFGDAIRQLRESAKAPEDLPKIEGR